MIESVGFDNEYEDRVDDVEDDANTKGKLTVLVFYVDCADPLPFSRKVYCQIILMDRQLAVPTVNNKHRTQSPQTPHQCDELNKGETYICHLTSVLHS